MKKSKQHNSQAPAAAAKGSAASASAVRPPSESGTEPTVRSASLPVFFIALLVALVYWGGMYVIETGGQADARVHSPFRSFKELQDLQPKGEAEVVMMKGKLIFTATCAPCHQNDGAGMAAQNFPPLAGSDWVMAKDPSRIIRIVLHGLSGPITVLGKEYGAATMPPFRDVYTDEQVAQVLSYVRNAWGNKAPVVKPESVKSAREETKDRSGPMSVEDLQKVLLKD